jgi:hypothetical protein
MKFSFGSIPDFDFVNASAMAPGVNATARLKIELALRKRRRDPSPGLSNPAGLFLVFELLFCGFMALPLNTNLKVRNG